jgi:hypothetical protein
LRPTFFVFFHKKGWPQVDFKAVSYFDCHKDFAAKATNINLMGSVTTKGNTPTW